MKRILPVLLLGGSIATLHAQSFFTSPTAQFLTPSWRGSSGTEYSQWDVFYAANGGINYPDVAAPHGSGQLASETLFPVPSDAEPGDPYAFWDTSNPTVTQVVPGNQAFIIGPGTTGNIYSPFVATSFSLADQTPYAAKSVVLQFQTDGSLMDFSSIKLVSGGVEYSPTNFITEYKTSTSPRGGTTNRSAVQWDLSAFSISNFTIKFQASSTSMSLQEMVLDTAPTYTEAVPGAGTWATGTGAWSVAGNWLSSTVPSSGGNVTIASGTGVTVDGGTRTVSELKLSAPGTFTIGASGGGNLKINTGITATPATPTTYSINAPVQMGSYNFISLNPKATVEFNQTLSGVVGFFLSGGGRLRLKGNNIFTGPATVDGSILEIGAGGVFPSSTTLNVTSGAVIVHGTLGGNGSLSLASSVIGGTGTITRSLQIGTGTTLAPGGVPGVGALATANQIWSNGGHFQLELADASATPGLGWDLANITGTLDLQASANGFILDLRSVSNIDGTLGLAQHFDPTQNYSWKFAGTTGGISGFSASTFTLLTADFQNDLAGGSFKITQSGKDLFLQFQAVPEPSSALLFGSGLLVLARRRRTDQPRH